MITAVSTNEPVGLQLFKNGVKCSDFVCFLLELLRRE